MIKINNDWQIDTDQYNVILQQRKVYKEGKNAGQEYWKNVGYYSSYEQALCALVDFEVKASADYKEIISKIEQLKADITNLPIINNAEELKREIRVTGFVI